MTPPTCPDYYACTFTPLHRYVVTRNLGPWWQHTAGFVVAILGVIALAIVLIVVVVYAHNRAEDRADRLERESRRKHELAIEEQRTMQADLAKGDPKMLAMIRRGGLG